MCALSMVMGVVEVLEGKVSVTTQQLKDRGKDELDRLVAMNSRTLNAGQLVKFDYAQTFAPLGLEHNNSTPAWQRNQLVFNSATLASIADEFNRYNSKKIIVDRTKLKGQRFSGVFSPTDPDSLLKYLELTEDINLVTNEESIDIVDAPQN